MFGIEFYPTPAPLIQKMMKKVNFSKVSSVLDPSAGRGDILLAVENRSYQSPKLLAIEIDPNLQAVLENLEVEKDRCGRPHKYSIDVDIIDSDFLEYVGGDHFDLIMMNPPFSNGDEHLLKAIDVMYQGQIVCILNAETIRNPYTNRRKALVRKLEELGADIEYIEDAFLDADRKTGVEIALIYLEVNNELQPNPFDGVREDADDNFTINNEPDSDVVEHNEVEAMVARYNAERTEGIEILKHLFTYKRKFADTTAYPLDSLTLMDTLNISNNDTFQKNLCKFTEKLRGLYWRKLAYRSKVLNKLTGDARQSYSANLEKRSKMEFNIINIRTVIANLMTTYGQSIEQSIVKLFDDMSSQHAWYPECKKNIYLFDGWKTNKAHKVNSKVILPHFHFINSYSGRWEIGYSNEASIRDIDLVMSYFDGGRKDYVSIVDALREGFSEDKTRNIESTYFFISVYKKGTLHLTFKDEGILRRFNVFAAKNKAWLPPAYGTKSTAEMTDEEREVVKNFDGKLENYTLLPTNQEMLRLAA